MQSTTKTIYRLTTILAAGPCAIIAMTGMAHAQEGAADTGGISEIVVTAQKRAENVQDVPIAITAVTSESLQERAVGDISSLSNMAPNVSLDAGTPFSGSTAVLSAFIRGIGQNDFSMNLDPGVGVYLDGVYLARTVGANLDLPDVERIEVLKGPQGTLFGRNTIGGAISVVTRDPGRDFSFNGDVTTGRFGRFDVRGTVDIPVAPDLGAIVTFSSKNRKGYVKRVPYPDPANYVTDPITAFRHAGYDSPGREGGQQEWTLRGKVKWSSDSARVAISGDYLRSDQSGMPNAVLAVEPDLPGSFAGTANIPGTALDPTGTTGFTFAGLYNFCIGSTAAQIAARNATALCGSRGTPLNPNQLLGGIASVNVDANPNNDRLPFDQRWLTTDKSISYATGASFSKMKSWGLTSNIDVDLQDNITLKSITGYRKLNWSSATDADNSPAQLLELSFTLRQWQFSQEFQLSGSFLDDSLKILTGAYFFKEKGHTDDYVTFSQGLLQIAGPNDLSTKNYAFFGQADWRLSDLIGVSVGARYTNERKRFTGGQSDLNGFNYKLFNCPIYGEPCTSALGFPNPDEPLRYYTAAEQRRKFDNFSPKIGIQLHPSRDVMVYGSFSKGYKTGGWTTRISNPLPYAPDFGPEKATSWEIGVKSMLLDRRLQLNAAAFTTKFDGIQLNFQEALSPTIKNAGTARIKGFEVEAVALPFDALTINMSLGYTDAYYTDVLASALSPANPFRAGTFVGASLPKTPKWKFNISPKYDLELGNSGRITFIADYTLTSAIWNDAERTYLLRRPKTDLLNASITYTPQSENWNLTFGGINITGERFVTSGIAQLVGGQIYGTYNRPGEWYARLGVKF